ncbi:GNAT family N-acetyltransferase [Celeribacter baekdonensis]|uniref:GNAT family N-acetyltransferase n=1 Tax=Celeribacter baekdonensis TaxID=875171 RepID=UPI00190297AC
MGRLSRLRRPRELRDVCVAKVLTGGAVRLFTKRRGYPSQRRQDNGFSKDYETHVERIADLFTATFTASEGAEEGALIGELARRLMSDTPAEDLCVLTAWDNGMLIGGIFFTRLTYAGDKRTVFMVAPVAVATAHQGKGIGQRLIAHGLDVLRQEGVDIAVTYGVRPSTAASGSHL